MLKYIVNVKYIKVKTNVIADTLSPVGMMQNPPVETFVSLTDVDMITSQLPAKVKT